jgi:hypothetical protein
MRTCDGSGAIFGERHENFEALVAVEAGIVVEGHTLILSLFDAVKIAGEMRNRGLLSVGSLQTPTDLPVVLEISKGPLFFESRLSVTIEA